MNKAEFITFISEKNNISKVEAGRSLKMITDSMMSALSNGDKISLVGFGSFEVRRYKAREFPHPKTGQKIMSGARSRVVFKAGQTLKDSVQGN